MLTLDAIRRRLVAHDAQIAEVRPGTFEAAVALILYDPPGAGDAPELLFIERATRAGDPWSGHMAFPGGRREAADASLSRTAIRETFEEVGVTLGAAIGRLDDFAGSRGPQASDMVVAPFVFEVDARPELALNEEVRSTIWVPLDWIVAPESTTSHVLRREDGARVERPAFQYDRYVVWGLTYRILGDFFALLGREL